MKIDTLIIGLGKIGMGYDYNTKKNLIRSHCESVKKNKNFKLVAAVDTKFEKRKQFKKKFKTSVFKKYSEALERSRPQLVILSTPITNHYEILNKVLKKKYVKFILCEKPITDSLKKTRKIFQKVKKLKKFFFVNYIRHSDSIINRVLRNNKKLIFSKNSNIKVNYYDSIYNNCSHFILFFIKLFGMPKKIKNINLVRKEKTKINSSINFDLVFKNNKLVSFNSIIKNKNKINSEINIKSKKKEIDFSYGSKKIIFCNNKKKKKLIYSNMNLSQKNVLNRLYSDLKKKGKYPIKINDALNVEMILDKIISRI